MAFRVLGENVSLQLDGVAVYCRFVEASRSDSTLPLLPRRG